MHINDSRRLTREAIYKRQFELNYSTTLHRVCGKGITLLIRIRTGTNTTSAATVRIPLKLSFFGG